MRHTSLSRTLVPACLVLLGVCCGCLQPTGTPAGSSDAADAAVAVAQSAAPIESASTPQPEAIRLSWNLKDGDRFRWTYGSGMELEGPRGDEIVKATVNVRMTFHVQVAAATEERFRMHYDLARLEMSSDAPELPIDYDSDKVSVQSAESPASDDESDEEFVAKLVEESMADLLGLEIDTVVDSSCRIHELNVVGNWRRPRSRTDWRRCCF